MQFIQRDTYAIVSLNDLKNELRHHFDEFLRNYRDAIRYANGSLIIKTCKLEELVSNYIGGTFVTYYQEKGV